MGESEHTCQGCKKSHLAWFWYSRTDNKGNTEWICRSSHNKLSPHEKTHWKLTLDA